MLHTASIVALLLPAVINTKIMTLIMLIIIGTVTPLSISFHNYMQDWEMKTKDKQSLSKRVGGIIDRTSELEKIKRTRGDGHGK